MSKDLLKRKKRRFVKAGGLNPPADILMPEQTEPAADEAEPTDWIPADALAQEAAAAEPQEAAGAPQEGVSDDLQDTAEPVPADGDDDTAAASSKEDENQFNDGLDLVFAELLEAKEVYVPEEPVSAFMRAGKRFTAALFSFLMALMVAYNTGVIEMIKTEVDSFRAVRPAAEELTEPVVEEEAPLTDATPAMALPEPEERGRVLMFVTCDGTTREQPVAGDEITVSDLLNLAGIVLGDEDVVEPSADTMLHDRDSVTVTRIKHVEYTETEVIPASTDIKLTPLLSKGRQKELYASDKRDGKKELTYRDEYIDGVRTKHDLISEKTVVQPVNSITLEGAAVSMSPINGARFTDIRISGNAPESYTKYIRGYCTAYNFKKGVWGASGMYLSQGFIAVDPEVIPYGSLCYITNSDSSFVYGWAIAADFCEAASWGMISADLFFDTYNETLLFGKHTMNIYIVKQLYRDELQQYVARQGYFDNRVPARPPAPPEPEPEPVQEEEPQSETPGGDPSPPEQDGGDSGN